MRWLTTTWCLMVAALFAMPAASAQEAQFASLSERLAQVEAELARYRAGESCEVPCDGGSSWDCRTPGLVAGADLIFMRPYQTEGQTPDYDFEATPRLWLGWQRADGLGIRARWFEYDGTSNLPTAIINDLNMVTIDLELTDTFTLGSKWEGLFSGGFRYAHYEEVTAANPGPTDFLEVDSAYGLVLGVELYRHLRNNIYLFGLARGSAMYGKDVFDHGAVDQDVTFFITELQGGAEYRREICGTTYLFARAAVESQYWAGVSDNDTEDIGLLGFYFSLGLAR